MLLTPRLFRSWLESELKAFAVGINQLLIPISKNSHILITRKIVDKTQMWHLNPYLYSKSEHPISAVNTNLRVIEENEYGQSELALEIKGMVGNVCDKEVPRNSRQTWLFPRKIF